MLDKNTDSYVNLRYPIEPMHATTITSNGRIWSPKNETHQHFKYYKEDIFYPQKTTSQEKKENIPNFTDFLLFYVLSML